MSRAEESGSLNGGDGVIRYASRAAFVAALLEALVEGRAFERWWLRDTDALRFLSTAQAIRTVALAEPRTGLEALASLTPMKRMQVLRALTMLEAERVLNEFARAGAAADFETCAETVAEAELPEGASALAAFVGAFALRPALMGETLAAAARLWSEMAQARRDGARVAAEIPSNPLAQAAATTSDQAARDILAPARSQDSSGPGALYRFTPFGGLLLLLPDVDSSNLASVASTIPDAPHEAAALISYVALLLIEFDTVASPAIAPSLREVGAPVFLSAPADESWRPHFAELPMIEIGFKIPDSLSRRALWTSALNRNGILAGADSVSHAADRFRLSGRQIETAVASLRLGLGLQTGEHGAATTNALLASARRQTEVSLGGLAQRPPLRCGWENLVLPSGSLGQLRRLGAAIRHRERVFSEWGFGGGPGVTALFSGGPGTGKSMSAGVLAREAGLDLWRIDLSAIVSKYIGETEKHLDRVFALACDGNAILFFDEADALFGKRSEVKDAHDRYANIEAAFLLQRLESFDGVVILASNLARNVDPAFSRRMHFVIDFPLPDVALRERLWRASLPERAPVADDVDLGFLARQFMLAGGDIRVAALDAAFAAADEDAAIDMARLCQAVARQLLKQGKIPAATDFQHYRALLTEGGTAAPSRTAAA